MTRDQFISFFFVGLLVFVVYQIFKIFSPFADAIFWSATLAFAFYPLYQKLRSKLKPNETLAALLMTAAIFLLVVPPVVILIVNITAQTIELYQHASVYVQEGGPERLIEQIRSLSLVQRVENQVFQWEPLKESSKDWILNTAKSLGNFAAGQAGTVTKNFFLVSLNVFLMTFLLFVFLKDGGKIYRFIYEITPMEEKNKRSMFRQVNDTFSAVIRGQMLTSLTQALVAGMVFWFLKIPLPLLFAAVTFLAALIPVSGASTVWLPLALYLFAIQEKAKAITLFIFGLLVISLIDNVMKPALIGEKTRLPYFLLFFGILGGLKLYGLMGIFIAPVVLSLFFILVKISQEKYSSRD